MLNSTNFSQPSFYFFVPSRHNSISEAPSVWNKIDNKLNDHLLFIQYSGVTNKQVTDELKQDNDEIKKKLNIYDLVISKSNKIPKQILVQNQNFSPENMYSPKANNSTTIITDINKTPPLKGDILQKMVTRGILNMRSYHQNSMNYSSR